MYTFKVGSFRIDNTRAVDEDSHIVGVAICVGDLADPNQQITRRRKDVGDVDDPTQHLPLSAGWRTGFASPARVAHRALRYIGSALLRYAQRSAIDSQ